jgi:hypothetical protein
MDTRDQLLDRIERSLDHHRFCTACGAPTTISEDADGLWLACTTPLLERSRLARLADALTPHDRRLVVESSGEIASAA